MRSFKPYFLNPKKPKNIRPNSPKLSRRTQRRLRLFLKDRGQKKRLPSTHVWHAKRFQMGDLWGMRLPLHIRDKGARGILRLSKHTCLVHDRSYMDCWLIPCENNDKLLQVGFPEIINHPRIVSGERMCADILSSDGRTVSTFQLYWKAGNVEVWTHPSAREQVQAILSPLSAVLAETRERYELIGCRADTIFEKLFGVPLKNFRLVPGLLQRIDIHNVVINIRSGGTLIDLIFDDIPASHYWRKLVAVGASAIGVLDRHALMAHYGAPDFPFDFPNSKAGAVYSAEVAKRMLQRHNDRPSHARMDTTTVESPFFPDWSLIGSPLRSVVVHAERGIIKWNSHIYSGSKLVGFVTSSFGDSRQCAIAHICSEINEAVFFRNPGSSHSYTLRQCEQVSQMSTESMLLGIPLLV